MQLLPALQLRIQNKCELCQSGENISLYELPYAPQHDEDGCTMICKKCLDQIEGKIEGQTIVILTKYVRKQA